MSIGPILTSSNTRRHSSEFQEKKLSTKTCTKMSVNGILIFWRHVMWVALQFWPQWQCHWGIGAQVTAVTPAWPQFQCYTRNCGTAISTKQKMSRTSQCRFNNAAVALLTATAIISAIWFYHKWSRQVCMSGKNLLRLIFCPPRKLPATNKSKKFSFPKQFCGWREAEKISPRFNYFE